MPTAPRRARMCSARCWPSVAPCVVLLDELVAYIRQFRGEPGAQRRHLRQQSVIHPIADRGGQARAECGGAGFLPESDSQAGGPRGVAALQALEAVFNRVQALWKTVATEEAFEIVRRRLFESIRDAKARDPVCRAFADAYVAEGAKVPQETQEARYFDRMVQSYPIHPEVFTDSTKSGRRLTASSAHAAC